MSRSPMTTPALPLPSDGRGRRGGSIEDERAEATLQITGEWLSETVGVKSGDRVLDVAGSSGNSALAAARLGAEVTATDEIGSLAKMRIRAEAEDLQLKVREARPEALPFTDSQFDVVMSTFGVMFTPEPQRAVAELLRMCRPGGRIGLTNWTPDSFVGQIIQLVGSYIPPPAGLPSPLEWGTKACVGALFGTEVESIGIRYREFVFRYWTPQYWLDTFRTFDGPTYQSLAVLDGLERDGLQRDLLALAAAHNTSPAGSMRIPSGYLEVLAVKSP
jgi:ubiquinone/menaquinone biosynthesis C-methylase UbiE